MDKDCPSRHLSDQTMSICLCKLSRFAICFYLQISIGNKFMSQGEETGKYWRGQHLEASHAVPATLKSFLLPPRLFS